MTETLQNFQTEQIIYEISKNDKITTPPPPTQLPKKLENNANTSQNLQYNKNSP